MVTLRGFVILLLLVCLPRAAGSEPCLAATMTAQETAPASGVWKYCLSLSYDVTALAQIPRHLKLMLPAISDCPCVNAPGTFAFLTPAGTSRGVDQLTGIRGTVPWIGDVGSEDDPNLPQFNGLVIDWGLHANDTWDPDLKGTGRFFFLSRLRPTVSTSTTAAIHLGPLRCIGTVTGPLPGCDCATPVRPGTWGRMKAIYR